MQDEMPSMDDASQAAPSVLPGQNSLASQVAPVKPKDFELFLNLVEFFKRFFFLDDVATFAAATSGVSHRSRHLSSTEQKPKDEHKSKEEKSNVSSSDKKSTAVAGSPGYICNHSADTLIRWFKPWILIFSKELISLSNRHPLVSGFYKLIAVLLRMCERLEFFDGFDPSVASLAAEADQGVFETQVKVKLEKIEKISHVSKSGSDATDNKLYVYGMIWKFMKEVVIRIQQLTQELLFAAIHMVLSVPTQLIDVPMLMPALQKALLIGLNYHPAALLSMDVLDRWTTELHERVKPHLPDILKYLAAYLRAPTSLGPGSAVRNLDSEDKEEDEEKETVESKSAKMKSELLEESNTGNEEDTKLVIRVLNFLGRMGGDNRHVLEATSEADLSMAWDANQHIKYALPFPTHKLDVYLDPLLPQITVLAEKSSHRKTKVTACEALHSIIIYMVQQGARDPNRVQQSQRGVVDMVFKPAKLYKRLFPVILRLAVDVEQVAKQLFAPLTKQLIHWFTNNQQANNPETLSLLDAITESVTSPVDGALREYSADCIFEFFKWSITQSSNSKTAINVTSLLRRLYSLAHHPNPYQRLGAALVFNRIYVSFREDNNLISQHLLDILWNMLLSLQMADADDSSLGTKEETREVVLHLERIIIDPTHRKFRYLLKANDRRKGPNECQTLDTFVFWLFETLGRKEETYRRMSQHLFQSLAPITTKVTSAQEWTHMYIKEHTVQNVVSIFEKGGVKDKHCLSVLPPKWLNAQHIDHSSSSELFGRYDNMVTWLDSMATSLDCYHWAFKQKFVDDPGVLLNCSSSKLLKVMRWFLNNIFHSAKILAWRDTLMPAQFQNYQQKKCTVVIRLFRFIHLMLEEYPSFTQITQLLEEGLYRLLFESLLSPSKSGFLVADTTRITQLQQSIGGLCRTLMKQPENIVEQAISNLKDAIKTEKLKPKGLKVDVLINDVGFYTFLVTGYKQLWTSGLLQKTLGAEQSTTFAKGLAHQTFTLSHQHSQPKTAGTSSYAAANEDNGQRRVLSPLYRNIGSQMLDLALHIGISDKLLFGFLSDPTPVTGKAEKESVKSESGETEEKEAEVDRVEATKGEEFYTNFRMLLDSFLILRFKIYAKPLLRSTFMSKELFTVTLNLADYCIRVRQKNKTLYLDVDNAFRLQQDAESGNNDSIEEFVNGVLMTLGPAFQWWVKKTGRTPSKREIFNFETDKELVGMTLRLIEKLLVLNDKRVLDSENPSYAFITDVYHQCLSKDSPFVFKKTALGLMPFFVTSSEPTASKAITSVQRMTTYPPFPAKSVDLDEDSLDWHHYIQLLEVLLEGLVLSKSFQLLEKLLGLLRERQHKCKDKIHRACKEFVDRINQPGKTEEFIQVVNRSFEIFNNTGLDRSPVDNARRFIVEAVCLPLLKAGPLSAVTDFFLKHTQSIWANIVEKPNGPTKALAVDEQQVELLELQCSYQLLEVLFRRFELSIISETQLDHKALMKLAYTHVKKCGDQAHGAVSYLEFHCAAYNCICAALIRTQKAAKFFDAVAFSENPSADQFLWDNIVDINTPLQFELAANYKQIEAHLLKEIDVKFLASRQAMQGKKKYLSSQYLGDSSLSQEIGDMRTFLDTSDKDAQNDGEAELARNDSQDPDFFEGKEDDWEEKEIEKIDGEHDLTSGEVMDLDPLNCNPSMASMLDLIDHMYKLFKADWRPTDMPQFMKMMCQKLNDSKTHLNVKWFITKIVVNRWMIFERYAQFWFRPLVALAILPNNGGKGFHYFLRDICYLFLQWTDFIPAGNVTDREYASKFLSHLFRVAVDHGDDESGEHWQRIRANIRMIKLLIEKWKDRVNVDKSVIVDMLRAQIDRSDRTGGKGVQCRYVGLQLLGILVVNDFQAFDPVEDSKISEESFIQILLDNLHQRKDLYQPAAEVYGMILKAQYTDASGERLSIRDKYQSLFRAVIKQLFQQQSWERFLIILQKVGMYVHDRHFFDSQYMNMIFNIPTNLHGSYLYRALQLIYWGGEDVENLFQRTRALMKKVLKDRDVKAHEMMLLVIHRALGEMTKNELFELTPQLVAVFGKHSNEKCRALYFKILIWIHDNQPDFEAARRSDPHAPIVTTVITALLGGLSDSSPAICKTMFDFWDDSSRLPPDLTERLLSCLTTLHQTDAETDWLRYCTFLLLHPLRKSTDFNRPFSDTPLAECKFSEMAINSQYTGGSLPFTPLFSISTQGQEAMVKARLERQNAQTNADAPVPFGMVRATQAAQFTPTQADKLMSMDASQLFDYNLQSQLENSKNNLFSMGDSSQEIPSGSLAEFNVGAKYKKDMKTRLRGRERQSIKFVTMNDIIQRRFNKKVASADTRGKSAAVTRKIREYDLAGRYKKIWKMRLQEEANQSVTMFRKYRTGELPDIQIHHRELLMPLQALHADPVVAKNLFLMVFKAVYKSLDKMHTAAKAAQVRQKIRAAIAHLLSSRSVRPVSSYVFSLHLATLECGQVDSSFTHLIDEDGIVCVGDMAFESKNYHSGVLLLEHMLANPIDDDQPSQAKRRRANVSDVDDEGKPATRHQEVWFQLARLYRELGEEDIVLSLYKKYAHSSYTKDAVAATLHGNFAAAIDIYHKALDHDSEGRPWDGTAPTLKEIDYWDDERLECCHHLTDWENLHLNILEQFDGDTSKVWTAAEMYLRHYIACGSKLNKERDNLYHFFEEGMKNPENRKNLESNYSADLALVFAQFGVPARAQFYLKKTQQRFLDQWSQLPLLAKGPRLRLLQGLQRLVEIDEFLQVHPDTTLFAEAPETKGKKGTTSSSPRREWDMLVSRTQRLVDVWSNRYPSRLDPVNVWDDVLVNRAFFLQQLQKGLRQRLDILENKENQRDPERQEVLADLESSITLSCITAYRKGASVLAKVGNHTVAHAYIQKSVTLNQTGTTKQREIDKQFLRYSGLKVDFYRTKDLNDKKQRAASLWKLREKLLDLDDELTDSGEIDTILMLKLNRLQSQVYVNLADLLKEDTEKYKSLKDPSTFEELYSDVDVYLQESATTCRDYIYNDSKRQSKNLALPRLQRASARAFMELASFCLKRLTEVEDPASGEELPEKLEGQLVYLLVQNILGAMLLNTKDARGQFPRVLELVSRCPENSKTQNLFTEFTDDVKTNNAQRLIPCWMFIQWIPQMFSVLGGPEGHLVMPILIRLAKVYPQAIYFPLQLSMENVRKIEPVNVQAKKFTDELAAILKMPLLEQFIEALDGMTNPELRFKDSSNAIHAFLHRGQTDKAVEAYQEVYKACLSGCRDHVGTAVGKLTEKFGLKYRKHFDNHFGIDGVKLRKMTANEFYKLSAKIQETFAKVGSGQRSLTHFSVWLVNYKLASGNANEYIELPGQYTGSSCPDPKNHVRIIGFDPNVTVMSSMRRPKAMVMHGDDEKEYKFLVKGGEDLRLDQRIEQLFGTMNEILQADALCSKRTLKLRTYQVVPMTGNVGILEWVNGTKPLKSIVLEQNESDPTPIMDLFTEYSEWITANGGPAQQASDSFVGVLTKCSENVVIKAFDKIQNKVPADLLLRGVASLCSTPESYLVLRSKFSRSFAVFSICSYVLGIGDRHLDNFLMDQTDGSLIGIDFGASFGMGVLLKVPELIPFRLTRQFQHLFQPLDTEGLLKQDMCHTLKALRDSRHILLTIMEVFVKEPQLDWVKSALAKKPKDFVGISMLSKNNQPVVM